MLSQITPSPLRNFFTWRQRQKLKAQLENIRENASTYQEWLDASLSYDKLMGWDSWKDKVETNLYDYKYILDCTSDMRKSRLAKNRIHILFHIWTHWSRNIGNINNPALYTQSCTGTKAVIENYIRECERCLDVLLTDIDPLTTIEDLLQVHETLTRTRQRFGTTALLLSGGGTMGMLHNGVLACLLEQDLLPQIINGSSAGSIVASVLCSSSKDELQGLLLEFGEQNLNVFEGAGNQESFFTRMSRFLKDGSWIDGSYLSGVMKELLGDLTFREAYYRTRRILNITVSSASIHEPPRLLNYLTAPEVLIRSAVCASCSVPLVFLSHALLYKDPVTGQVRRWDKAQERWIDGSVANDVPIAKLAELFNVNLFIVSQVNPHVVPFVKDVGQQNVSPKNSSRIDTVLDIGCQLAMEESKHILAVCAVLGIAPVLCKRLTSVLCQRYSGDINIFPKLYLGELAKILKNPTVEFMTDTMRRGQQSTWPKITLIRHTCALEFALESAIARCRTLIMEKQQSSVPTTTTHRLMRSRSDRHMGERPPKIFLKKSMVFSIPSQDLQPYSWVADASGNNQDNSGGYNHSNLSLGRSRARTNSLLFGRLSWNKFNNNNNNNSTVEMAKVAGGHDMHRSSTHSPSRPSSPLNIRAHHHFKAPSDPGSPLHLFVSNRFNEDGIKNKGAAIGDNDPSSEVVSANTVPLRKIKSNKGNNNFRNVDTSLFPKLPTTSQLPSIDSQDSSDGDKRGVCDYRKSSPSAPSPLQNSTSRNKDRGGYFNLANKRFDNMPPTCSSLAMRQSRSHSPLTSPTRSTHLNGSNLSPGRLFNDDSIMASRTPHYNNNNNNTKLYKLNGSALFDSKGNFEGFENPDGGVFESSEEEELLGMFGNIAPPPPPQHTTTTTINSCSQAMPTEKKIIQHEQYVLDSDDDNKIGLKFLSKQHSALPSRRGSTSKHA